MRRLSPTYACRVLASNIDSVLKAIKKLANAELYSSIESDTTSIWSSDGRPKKRQPRPAAQKNLFQESDSLEVGHVDDTPKRALERCKVFCSKPKDKSASIFCTPDKPIKYKEKSNKNKGFESHDRNEGGTNCKAPQPSKSISTQSASVFSAPEDSINFIKVNQNLSTQILPKIEKPVKHVLSGSGTINQTPQPPHQL